VPAVTQWRNFESAAGRMAQIIVTASRDPNIANTAIGIVRPLRPGFPANEAAALCRYVTRNIRYTNDVFNEDFFRNPAETIRLGAGDCNNKAVLFCALARAIGFPVRLVFLFASTAPDLAVEYPAHVWAEVDLNKGERSAKWVPCESTPLPLGYGQNRLGVEMPFGTAGTGGGLRVVVDVDAAAANA